VVLGRGFLGLHASAAAGPRLHGRLHFGVTLAVAYAHPAPHTEADTHADEERRIRRESVGHALAGRVSPGAASSQDEDADPGALGFR
jgi:hypothetical protein